MSRFMQRSNSFLYFFQSIGGESWVRGKEVDGIIAPGVRKALLREVPFISPGHERHQFNRINTKPEKMFNAFGMCERGYRASKFFRNERVTFGKSFDRHFINEVRCPVR